jgi:glycosyltransferase involved in cell wall biosynthesis
VHIIIDALARMKVPVTLTIVGDGEDRADLEQLVRTHKLANVHFEGFKPATELIRYYDRADVLVVSSEREGMSLTVLEALAAGLPIVSSNAPGLGKLLKGVGILVDEPTGQAFAEALDSLLRDPEMLARLSQQSSEAAQAYSSVKVTDAVEQLYAKILREAA